MCTQEIIWCACAHGELLPIVKCAHAELLGTCWTVVHGDHRVVVQMRCSYCLSLGAGGLSAGFGACEGGNGLGGKARPEGELAGRIEGLTKEGVERGGVGGEREDAGEVWVGEDAEGQVPAELRDVVNTDWEGFTLDPELWQYV